MFQLRVLGGFALEGPSGGGAATLPISKRRGEALLAVLAVSRDLGCTRERLIALLWPESDEAHARHGLRTALHALRQVVGAHAVLSPGDTLRLDPAVVDSDVQVFSRALEAGRPLDAVRVYAGALLEGFHIDDAPEFDRWLDRERMRLTRLYAETLGGLAGEAEQAGKWGEAAGWWARAEEHDPLNSHVALRHAEALAAMGDRANAIKVADEHARRLREELELDPDPEFVATIDQIRRGDGPFRTRPRMPPPPALSPQIAAAVSAPPQPDLSRHSPRWVPWAAGAAIVLVGIGGLRLLSRPGPTPGPPRTTIAVLPFQDLSGDSARSFLAVGLRDELLTQLGRVAALKVIARTSVREYQRTTKPLHQIGEELTAGSLVEASVQMQGRRLRVAVRLLEPSTEAQMWGETYDRTIDDVFAVESDIAQRIVTAVGATLTTSEAGVIRTAPTAVPEAYQFYLQGLDYARRPGQSRESLRIAQQLYEHALALDSAFALAHATLSTLHYLVHTLQYDRSATRVELARGEAEAALRLDPNLPQAHFAIGQARYEAQGDERGALREFTIALRSAPNDAVVWAAISLAQARLNNYDSASVAFDRALSLDPRNTNLLLAQAWALHHNHRYPEAIRVYRHVLELAPDFTEARLAMSWSYILWKGDLDTLRAALHDLPPDGDPRGGGIPIREQRVVLQLWERHPDSVLALLHGAVGPVFSGWGHYIPRLMWAAWAQVLRADTAAARADFDSALVLLDSAERALPDDPEMHSIRGYALMGLGRRQGALAEARWLDRYNQIHGRDDGLAANRAGILAGTGDAAGAVAELERQLFEPSIVSVNTLRLDPTWDPLRNDPRFQALLARYANPERGAP